ncbi:MAG: agmatine deiminase family protein [Ilumatobacteraceae bacterium]
MRADGSPRCGPSTPPADRVRCGPRHRDRRCPPPVTSEAIAMQTSPATPSARGFRMPAEWEPHAGCVMQWPSRPELWGDLLVEAEREYAAVADAIARFEPVIMLCNPGCADDVAARCHGDVRPVELPLNDSWARDSGPIFIRDGDEFAVAGFRFNAWGERWHPHDDDAAVSRRVADLLGLEWIAAPLVLEGGSFFVDGCGTLITTEQCLLNANRNPHLSRAEIADVLCDFLGVREVVWLPYGHSADTGPTGTDGHIDGVLQYVAPGRVMLELVADPASPEHEPGLANLAALRAARDADGRAFTVELLDPGIGAEVSYANHYLANGAVVVPVAGGGNGDDVRALARLAEIHPDREIVPVAARTIAAGGGGPHCITQQVPAGITLP